MVAGPATHGCRPYDIRLQAAVAAYEQRLALAAAPPRAAYHVSVHAVDEARLHRIAPACGGACNRLEQDLQPLTKHMHMHMCMQ